MTAAYNPAEVDRLVREAREHDEAMGEFVADPDHRPDSAVWFMRASHPENARGIEWMRANIAAMADQLEAAREMADRVPDLQAAVGYEIEKRDRFERERDAARTEVDQLRARVAELEGFVRATPDACLQADKVDRDEFPGLFTDEDGARMYLDEAKRRILARTPT